MVTVWRYFTRGPPRKSWSLKYYLNVELVKAVMNERVAPDASYEVYTQTVRRFRKVVVARTAVSLRKLKRLFTGVEVDSSVRIKRQDAELSALVANDRNFNYAHHEPHALSNCDEDFEAEYNMPVANMNSKNVVLYFHGGAHLVMDCTTHRKMAAEMCQKM